MRFFVQMKRNLLVVKKQEMFTKSFISWIKNYWDPFHETFYNKNCCIQAHETNFSQL